jgi:hypothetical protein
MLSRSQVIPVSVVPWILLVLVALVAPGAMARADGEASDVGLIRASSAQSGRMIKDARTYFAKLFGVGRLHCQMVTDLALT